ncbi:DUF1441 family protein [Salmonella enterica]|nr:DUF1441 family protein [Salmonella enterica]
MATTNGQGSKKKRSDLNLYLIASFFALLRMVIPSAKCHANQCKTFRRATDKLKLYRVTDIVSAFLALPPPVAEGEMDAHERKAWYQSERERLKFEQETAQLIPASDVRREFAIWAKAVVQVLETLPDILERDCGLQPAAVSRVQSIIDDLRDQIAQRVTEAGSDDEEESQQEE